jgi:hypothetical protein
VAVLDGAGTAVSVLVAVASSMVAVFFFLEKRDLSLLRGDSARIDFASVSCRTAV